MCQIRIFLFGFNCYSIIFSSTKALVHTQDMFIKISVATHTDMGRFHTTESESQMERE